MRCAMRCASSVGELGARWRLDPAKVDCAGGLLYVHPIDKQHVKVQQLAQGVYQIGDV